LRRLYLGRCRLDGDVRRRVGGVAGFRLGGFASADGGGKGGGGRIDDLSFAQSFRRVGIQIIIRRFGGGGFRRRPGLGLACALGLVLPLVLILVLILVLALDLALALALDLALDLALALALALTLALALLLALRLAVTPFGVGNTVVVLGKLQIGFRRHPVTGRRRIAGQSLVFFLNLLRGAADFHIRAVAFKIISAAATAAVSGITFVASAGTRTSVVRTLFHHAFDLI